MRFWVTQFGLPIIGRVLFVTLLLNTDELVIIFQMPHRGFWQESQPLFVSKLFHIKYIYIVLCEFSHIIRVLLC